MLQVAIEIVAAIVLFGGGVLVGAHNVVTVDKAIATLDAAEKQAAADLEKITAHKSTTAAA